MFEKYSKTIKAHGKALLFCIIGGKLSEGINFADDLCRQLIIAGLPYANNQSIEIKERINYWNNNDIKSFTGKDYYDNMCIKMVNQALGRALRHINDYAYIMLVDFRFQGNLLQKLPKWVKLSFKNHSTSVADVKELEEDLDLFFENKL